MSNKFPEQIIGVKDSSYNLYENLKLKNFSILPGSETKLLKGLELGCSGIITATCNVTAELSRKVYDDFFSRKKQLQNDKLCDVRSLLLINIILFQVYILIVLKMKMIYLKIFYHH